jgi:hypothetical protein
MANESAIQSIRQPLTMTAVHISVRTDRTTALEALSEMSDLSVGFVVTVFDRHTLMKFIFSKLHVREYHFSLLHALLVSVPFFFLNIRN